MKETRCRWGTVIRVPDDVAGRTGKCPACDEPISIPGSPAVQGGGRGLLFQEIIREPAMLLYRNKSEREALRYTFISGFGYLLLYASFILHLVGGGSGFIRTVGWTGALVSPAGAAWLYALFFIQQSLTTSAICRVYSQITGEAPPIEPVGFAKAGGFDIRRWSPMFTFAGLFLVYWATSKLVRDPISWIRGPWIFLALGTFLNYMLAYSISYRVFEARFGRKR